MLFTYNNNNSLRINIKVKPRAKTTNIIGTMQIDGTCYLKIGVKEAAESGKANDAIIKFLSQKLRVPQKNIAIIVGHTNPHKLIEISNVHDIRLLEINIQNLLLTLYGQIC